MYDIHTRTRHFGKICTTLPHYPGYGYSIFILRPPKLVRMRVRVRIRVRHRRGVGERPHVRRLSEQPHWRWPNQGAAVAKLVVRSGEIPSPGQTSSDKTNDCAMKSERGAPVRGSDPPSRHSVHKTTGDRWRAPARRLIHIWALLCRKQATKNLDSSPMAKNRPFVQVWEKSVGRRG